MKIDKINGDIINTDKINIHDYIFKELKFDYSNKNIYILLLGPEPKAGSIIIIFFNVIGFNMISCDFWGKSPHVLDWEFVQDEEQLLTNKLLEEKHNFSDSKLEGFTTYMETVMTLTSGDLLTIVCEYIDLQI